MPNQSLQQDKVKKKRFKIYRLMTIVKIDFAPKVAILGEPLTKNSCYMA